MAKVRRLLWRLSLLFSSARLVPWRAALRLHDRSSTVVFWLHGRKPESWLRYLAHEDTVLMDAGWLRALVRREVPFRLVPGDRIDRVRDSTIVYTVHPYNPSGAPIPSDGLRTALADIAGRGNRLVPTLDAARFWENKVHMHERFDEAGVRTPPTRIVHDVAELEGLDLPLPLMVKDPWSYGSYGIVRVDDRRQLETAVAAVLDTRAAAIVQGFIDIRADARITVAAGRVAQSLLRRNPAEEWSMTLARYGTVYEFDGVPERWNDTFVEMADRLGLATAAFDACWEGDDLATEPIVLEVSPAYQLNPEPPEVFRDRPYRDYAATWWGRDAHPARQAALVARIEDLVLDQVSLP